MGSPTRNGMGAVRYSTKAAGVRGRKICCQRMGNNEAAAACTAAERVDKSPPLITTRRSKHSAANSATVAWTVTPWNMSGAKRTSGSWPSARSAAGARQDASDGKPVPTRCHGRGTATSAPGDGTGRAQSARRYAATGEDDDAPGLGDAASPERRGWMCSSARSRCWKKKVNQVVRRERMHATTGYRAPTPGGRNRRQ